MKRFKKLLIALSGLALSVGAAVGVGLGTKDNVKVAKATVNYSATTSGQRMFLDISGFTNWNTENVYFALYFFDAQNQNGIFPMHYEFFGDNKMLSVTKLVNNPVVAIVDLFFQVDNKVYGYHTYLPNDEKQVELNDLCQNYPNIRYVVDEINKF